MRPFEGFNYHYMGHHPSVPQYNTYFSSYINHLPPYPPMCPPHLNPFFHPHNFKPEPNRQIEVIKLEENSDEIPEIQIKIKSNNKPQQQSSSKKITPKPVVPLPKIQVPPPKKVNYKVKYFDVSVSPAITSDTYFLIDDKPIVRKPFIEIEEKAPCKRNELEKSEEDENPFIVFKNRRIKKKFKKYLKVKILRRELEESESCGENESEESHVNVFFTEEEVEESHEVENQNENIEISHKLQELRKHKAEKVKRELNPN